MKITIYGWSTSKLATTFAGNALKAAQDEVATQKARNQPVQISVDHRPRVLRITASEGLIEDNYRNHSVELWSELVDEPLA